MNENVPSVLFRYAYSFGTPPSVLLLPRSLPTEDRNGVVEIVQILESLVEEEKDDMMLDDDEEEDSDSTTAAQRMLETMRSLV